MAIYKGDNLPDLPKKRRRQPKGDFLIEEMIKLGRYKEAMDAADENVEYYEKKLEEQRELYHKASLGYVRTTSYAERLKAR